ncbi:hemagglutinin repeat-containing protein [Mannheimia sp. E30BD]|uniref:hemagglutinin repeat-containing protein n=1 Tax=Mannheimia sp. E30BD TaxID=3278708 RepID=UPI00359F04B0
MNNIHQVIFNKSTQQSVVVSELAKSVKKTKAVSASSVDIVSILQNFSEKRPLGTTDTQTNRSDNKSSSWSVGVFVGKSQGSTGFGVEGAVNVGKGHSNSDSRVQNQTEINSDSLNIKTKETTTLKGAVANINHLELDTKNLHIESVQDTEKYNSKQTQGGVSGSVAIYGSGSSASAQFSQQKANVDYAQVHQQSGFNIQESSKINVEENTHIKGGIIHAQGDKANHRMTTGTLTTEAIENRSDIKVSSVSAGASTDMGQMATMAVGAALSALGNMSESERSQTKAAISSNINLSITDSNKQQQLTGKTAEETIASLNRDTANANQAVEKADLNAIQERQEATQIVAEIGAQRVGDFAQYMGWEDGSPQKVALHGLVGYLAAKVGGDNTAASTLSAMGSEYINTEIANYLQENTALTADERNAIQQASAAGLGALIGASLGGDSNEVTQSAQMALRTEKFNRQLHPDEKQRIKDLANGDKEKEARLTAAACALVHCSAQIPSDDPEYAEVYAQAKALEDLGNQAEFASERELLSRQLADYDISDGVSGYRKKLFQYDKYVNRGIDSLNQTDTKYGVTTRVVGAVQTAGGATIATGSTLGTIGACTGTVGAGCIVAVPIGAIGAAYGSDLAASGIKAVYTGKYHSPIGSQAFADLTGISQDTADLIYGAPSAVFGAKPIVMGVTKSIGVVANEVARIGRDVKYVAGELGKDVKVGAGYINNSAQTGYVHSINTARDITEQGLNTGATITRNLNNKIENTGTKKFGLGVLGGGAGELAVESRSYSEGKKDLTPTNLIGTTNNILKSGLTGGVTANMNTLQALGVNTVSGITLKNQSGNEAFKESIISSGVSSLTGFRGYIEEPASGLTNSILTDEIKAIFEKYKSNNTKEK